MTSAKSRIEESFAFWLTIENLPDHAREYQFHPTRKWRFDFAWVDQKVAVEIEGITYGDGGRHQQAKGFIGDCEKYEAALLLGWKVYRVPGQWVTQGRQDIWRPQVMETIRTLLEI